MYVKYAQKLASGLLAGYCRNKGKKNKNTKIKAQNLQKDHKLYSNRSTVDKALGWFPRSDCYYRCLISTSLTSFRGQLLKHSSSGCSGVYIRVVKNQSL